MLRTIASTRRQIVGASTRACARSIQPTQFSRSFSGSPVTRLFGKGSGPTGDITEEQAATIDKFGETLRTNPELSQLLDGFQTLLASKGISTGGKPPSIPQMMKMLADKEVRDHLNKLKNLLESANIKINQQDLSALTDYYLSQKK